MGYVAKYRAEAQEKNLPNWERFAIAEIEKTGEAILIYRNPHTSWFGGKLHYTANEYPELPMMFPTYQEAFAWLERKLTKLAPDSLKAEVLSPLEYHQSELGLPAVSG